MPTPTGSQAAAGCSHWHTTPEEASAFDTDPDLLPPRHRRPRNRQVDSEEGRDMILDGNAISFLDLSQTLTEKDLYDTIRELGFQPHAITAVTLQPKLRTGAINFSHSYLANDAFSLLRQKRAPFWTVVDLSKPADRIGSQIEVIDLTEDDTSDNDKHYGALSGGGTAHIGSQSTPEGVDLLEDEPVVPPVTHDIDKLYGAFSRAVYDDVETESETGSESSSPRRVMSPPLPEMVDFPEAMTVDGLPDPRPTEASNHGATHGTQKAPQPRTRPAVSARQLPAVSPERPPIHVVPMPKSPHNFARRVLLPQTRNLPILTVSMRADIQFFDRQHRYRMSKLSIPNTSNEYRHVVDAVMEGDTAVVAYGNGPFQLSLIRFPEGRSPSLTGLSHNPHKRLFDSETSSPNAAVSCLAARSSAEGTLQAFTGGYDKAISLWSVTASEFESARITSTVLTRLTTIPEALAFRSRGNLLVATSRKLLILHLEHLSSRPAKAQMSNAVHQIHLHKQAPDVVDNLDYQIQIFDDRKKRGFDRAPDSYFGGRFGGAPSKFSRGDTHHSLFVKGYNDGTVCLWDYRNAKKPVLVKQHRELGPIVHSIFTTSGVICYGKEALTFFDI